MLSLADLKLLKKAKLNSFSSIPFCGTNCFFLSKHADNEGLNVFVYIENPITAYLDVYLSC